jgi:hypothetical protein
MPTNVEHSIIAVLKPHQREGTDLTLDLTGLRLPDTVDVAHHRSPTEGVSMYFTLTADEGLHFDLDIHLLLPAVTPTDFLLG